MPYQLQTGFLRIIGDGLSLSKPTIGLIMLGAMLFVIFIGFPISFTLIFLAFVFGIWGSNFKLTTLLMTLNTNSTMLNDQLMAVPLFILMGIVMEAAGLMERLFASIQMIMSRIRGSLYIAVLIVSTIFAAATGIVGASVTLLGIMAGATMTRSGYNVQLAAGTITAGGTLGILIPPSIMLIVMGPVLDVSTLDLFRGAFIPGAILATLYLVYTLGRCWLNPTLGPILAEEDQPETSKNYGLEGDSNMYGCTGHLSGIWFGSRRRLGVRSFRGPNHTDRSFVSCLSCIQAFGDPTYRGADRSDGPSSLGCTTIDEFK